MLKNVQRIKGRLEKSTNHNEVYLYKTILDNYEIQIRNILTSPLNREEKDDLLSSIKTKQQELRELLKSSEKTIEIDRLKDFLARLEQYKNILLSDHITAPNDPNHDLQRDLQMELALGLSEVRNVVYQRSNYSSPTTYTYEPDYTNIARLIEIDSDKDLTGELISYTKIVEELEDYKKYAEKRFRVQEEFAKLLPSSKLLSDYQDLIDEYFNRISIIADVTAERKKVAQKLGELQGLTNPIKKHFAKKSIAILESQLAQLSEQLTGLKERLASLTQRINDFINGIEDNKLHNLFRFNKEILLTLGYIPSKANPFNNNELDLTFQELLNSNAPTDIHYFIGSNLHCINDENLTEINAYLDEIVLRLKLRIDELEEHLDLVHMGLSPEASTIIEKEPEIAKTVVALNKTINRFGVGGMDYIYALDALNNINAMGVSDLTEYINSSYESVPWVSNPLAKTNKRLSKKQN